MTGPHPTGASATGGNPGPDIASLPEPPAWTIDAACAQIGPDLFFPEKGGSTSEAKFVCAQCPVRRPCLAYAIDFEATTGNSPHGFYGGVSAGQRRKMHRAAGRDVA